MKVWYDVTDLMAWELPHLTGIQRTNVGILNGLVANGVGLQLVHFDLRRQRFEAIDVSNLPEPIVRHLPWAHRVATGVGTPPDAQAAPAPDRPKKRKRWLTRSAIFGTTPEASELRDAMRQFKHAGRNLRKKFAGWSRVRFQTVGRRQRGASDGGRTVPVTEAAGPFGSFGNPGDVLLSMCASWMLGGHPEGAAALRSHGVTVLRMIYDLIPVIKPQWVDDGTPREVTKWARNLLTESDGVFTISEFSRSEIEAYCHESRFAVPPITVVRLGDELESATNQTPPLPRFVPKKPFFVCVSTLDVRKNHRLLYDAWQVMAARNPDNCPDLVCLGIPHLFVRDLLREVRHDRAVNRHIHFLQGIRDEELAWYYRHCAATIYPSRYEGWGLPVAESLCHGRLCLASNATSIPEISPDLPAFFDPFDVHGLVALVERTLRDPAWVEAKEADIRDRFRPTSWRDTAHQVMAAVKLATAK